LTAQSDKYMAASVRQRLLNVRDATGTDYNALLTQYAIERFLYRLAQSELSDQFVLKGAMLFRVWSGELHRPTKDLDLLGHGDPTPRAVADAIRRVIATPVADDGLTFDSATVNAREIREEQEYGGIRVRLVALLGNARIPMQIDVGFGDAITPGAEVRSYPTLLDMEAPTLRMYPPETVVAEKVEAAVRLGMTNSRMKDYYDLLVLLRDDDLTEENLAAAMAATFRRRQTPIPTDVPSGLSDEFGMDERARRLWTEFRRRMEIHDAPADLADLVNKVRPAVWAALVRAREIEDS
jgi:predicted nucleotidyltransferase component of viral defense system